MIKYLELNEKLRNVEFDSPQSLLQENFDLSLCKDEYYPFYKYFIYTDYVLESIFKNKQLDKKYIMLNKYKDRKNKDDDKKVKHLENLILFNTVNNLLYETYSNIIQRKTAEERILDN